MALVSIGRVTGETIGPNKDGTKDVRLLQVEISSPEDVQTVELLTSGGEEVNPPLDSWVLVVNVGSWKVGVALNDGIVPTMDVGEKKLYSVASGAIVAFINLLKTGIMQLSGTIIELNGNTDFAVRYSVLKAQFDQLKSEHDTHVHLYLKPSSGLLDGTSVTTVTSTADMSGAKVDEVKVS